MLANLGLWNGTSPSTPTTQVKGLQVYTMPPKLNASSWLSQSLNQDEILGWPRQQRKNWRWRRHGSMTKTYWMTLMVRGSLKNGPFISFRHFPSASLGTWLMKLHGTQFCTIYCPMRTSLGPSKWTLGRSGTQSTTTIWTSKTQ